MPNIAMQTNSCAQCVTVSISEHALSTTVADFVVRHVFETVYKATDTQFFGSGSSLIQLWQRLHNIDTVEIVKLPVTELQLGLLERSLETFKSTGIKKAGST